MTGLSSGIDAQNLALIHRPVSGLDVSRRRQILRVVHVAVIREEVVAVIAAAQIQLAIRSEHETAGAMIGAVREAGQDVDGARQSFGATVIRVSPGLYPQEEPPSPKRL